MPKIDLVATGQNIKYLIKQNNLRIVDVQRALGLSTAQSIYKWFIGKNLPTIDNMVILADLLNCKIDDIIILASSPSG